MQPIDRNQAQKLELYEDALRGFLERVREDRTIVAVVRLGSLDEAQIWHMDEISLWVIEVDGVSRRLRSDGNNERIWRTFCEEGVNLNAEIIPRSRFKRMVEGSSRTAFTCNFFSKRELVYCADPSIESWFREATQIATKEQALELLVATTWLTHAHRYAGRLFEIKKDLQRTVSSLVWVAHSIASIEIIRRGEIYEDTILYKAMEYEPELFETIYSNVVGRKPTKKSLRTALSRVDAYLDEHGVEQLEPVLHFLRKQQRVVPLSEMCEHFAHTQLYPWHLESACEWLEQRAVIEKVAAPYAITKKSRVEVEEPAYFMDA